MAVCLERCAIPLVSCSWFALALLFQFWRFALRVGQFRGISFGMELHTSRGKPRFARPCLKAGTLRMAVCFERGAIPKHHRCLGIAPLSRQTAILGFQGLGKYRDTDLGFKGLGFRV